MHSAIRLFAHPASHVGDWLNFVITNRLPRRAASRLMLRLSRIENPVFATPALWLWQNIAGLDLADARNTNFKSIHDCFIRELKAGARPVDDATQALVAPCDGHIVAAGQISDGQILQVKGSYYALSELIGNEELAKKFEGGTFITIRITSSMYHRMHAPVQIQPNRVDYIPGDSFNVNPQTLRHVDGVYCKNERAVIHATAQFDGSKFELLIVPVAAILVGGIVLRCLPGTGNDTVLQEWAMSEPEGWTTGARPKHITHLSPEARRSLDKGEELGRFEHGSTIVLVLPANPTIQLTVSSGEQVQVGQRLATATTHNPLTTSDKISRRTS